MEENITPENQNEELNQETQENEQEEVLKIDLMNCPPCRENNKIKIQSVRRIDGNKVKPLDILVCIQCGTMYTDPEKLFDSI